MKARMFFIWLLAFPNYAAALDWTQPILDENGNTIPNCRPASDGTQEPGCTKILTIGALVSRSLLEGDPTSRPTPEQKALEGHLGLEIILHQDLVPTPEQLKLARDAIGRLPSPLAVARGFDILDAAIK